MSYVDAATETADPSLRKPFEARLSALLGPLRRAVLRRTRDREGLPDLPEAQIELLRLLVASGGLPPSRAALELRMAPSTISNLLRVMIGADLVQRLPHPRDGRAVILVASARARDLLERYDRASAAMLREAIARLPVADRDAVRTAIPALERLLAGLDTPSDIQERPADSPESVRPQR